MVASCQGTSAENKSPPRPWMTGIRMIIHPLNVYNGCNITSPKTQLFVRGEGIQLIHLIPLRSLSICPGTLSQDHLNCMMKRSKSLKSYKPFSRHA